MKGEEEGTPWHRNNVSLVAVLTFAVEISVCFCVVIRFANQGSYLIGLIEIVWMGGRISVFEFPKIKSQLNGLLGQPEQLQRLKRASAR